MTQIAINLQRGAPIHGKRHPKSEEITASPSIPFGAAFSKPEACQYPKGNL